MKKGEMMMMMKKGEMMMMMMKVILGKAFSERASAEPCMQERIAWLSVRGLNVRENENWKRMYRKEVAGKKTKFRTKKQKKVCCELQGYEY